MRQPFSTVAFVAFSVMTAAAPSIAWAQANPSADAITRSLMPTGNAGGLTRGIRPAAPSTGGATPAPAPVPGQQQQAVAPLRPVPGTAGARPQTPPAQAAQAAPSVNLTVEFRTGSADLTPQATHTLDELGRALTSSQLAAFRFRIEGHTDTVGTPESNKLLSQRRATAVVDYLVTRFRVDRARLEAVGMGEDGLLVTTPAQTSEPRNRRVQVVNLSA